MVSLEKGSLLQRIILKKEIDSCSSIETIQYLFF
jgi:hypothetical protein